MNHLEEHKTTDGLRTLSRNGRCLCSPRDPQKEAEEWLSRQKIHSEDRTVVVLGLGAGYHLIALVNKFPKLALKVIDLDDEIFQTTKSWIELLRQTSPQIQCYNHESAASLSCLEYDLVLNFRPAWAGLENQYMVEYFRLTQNSASSLARAAEENRLEVTSQGLKDKISSIDFSLKDLDFVGADGGNEEVKFWRALRELIE